MRDISIISDHPMLTLVVLTRFEINHLPPMRTRSTVALSVVGAAALLEPELLDLAPIELIAFPEIAIVAPLTLMALMIDSAGVNRITSFSFSL